MKETKAPPAVETTSGFPIPIAYDARSLDDRGFDDYATGRAHL